MKIHENSRTFFRLAITAVGLMIFVSAFQSLPVGQLDLRFGLLAIMTVAGTSRLAVRIPMIEGRITVSDTLIYLTFLLYGGEAAIVVAALEGLTSSQRISKQGLTILFNASVMALSMQTAVLMVRLFLDRTIETAPHYLTGRLIAGLVLLSLSHYLVNSWLVSIDRSLKAASPFWTTWIQHYLWTSMTYFAGAFAAGAVSLLITDYGFFPVFLTMPVIAIVYFTYRTYMNSVAIAEEQAAKAGLSIEEKQRHISELEEVRKELQESREFFRHASLHDMLTGLPNRALLVDRLEQAIIRGKRHDNYIFAVIFLDLDRFKVVNDSLGHAAGDQLLVTIARRLRECLRSSDTVARLGGDEFAIVLDDLEEPYSALQLAERLQKAVNKPVWLEGEEVVTTASIGIAVNVPSYDNPESILRDADSAMYQAKQNGKARHELFDESMHTRALLLMRLENNLRGALTRQEFFLCYQPIVSLDDGTIKGFEPLIRWRHPEQGVLLPADFISVAAEAGLSSEIGEWVLTEACNQMVEWQKQGLKDCFVSVNISAKEFADNILVKHVSQVLERSGLDPGLLHLEITEGDVMEDAERACVTLNKLRALGVHLSIDDFGTGYSSLSYLARFPIYKLKIDRSFISEMPTSDETLEIVRAIVTLASALSIDVVAEGVETQEQRRLLQAMNVTHAQGFLFYRPLESHQVNELIAVRDSLAVSERPLEPSIEVSATQLESAAVN